METTAKEVLAVLLDLIQEALESKEELASPRPGAPRRTSRPATTKKKATSKKAALKVATKKATPKKSAKAARTKTSARRTPAKTATKKVVAGPSKKTPVKKPVSKSTPKKSSATTAKPKRTAAAKRTKPAPKAKRATPRSTSKRTVSAATKAKRATTAERKKSVRAAPSAAKRAKAKTRKTAKKAEDPSKSEPARSALEAQTSAKMEKLAAISSPPPPVPRKATWSIGTVGTASTTGFLRNLGIEPYDPPRGEPYMSQTQHQHFHEILIRWREKLMEDVDRTVNNMQGEVSNLPDPVDQGTNEGIFEGELRTRDRERQLIKKIARALEKLEIQDYGYCDDCGIEIGLRRLEARPIATKCVDCKERDEVREKQERGG